MFPTRLFPIRLFPIRLASRPGRFSALLAVAAALALTGCGSNGNAPAAPTTSPPSTSGPATSSAPGSTSPTGSPTTPSAASSTPGTPTAHPAVASAYFFAGTKIAPAHRQVAAPAVARGAIDALLAGPSSAERASGLTTAIPAGTRLLGLVISNGTATANLSKDFNTSVGGAPLTPARVAQVVFTLTQFETVHGAQLQVEGRPLTGFGGMPFEQPLTRTQFEDWSPAVLVESPTIGDTVHSPARIYGSANTFEAIFQLEITDWDGKIVAQATVHATSGTGTRGTFDVTLPYRTDRTGSGEIIASYFSAKDGSRVVVAEIPLTVSP